MNIFGEIRENVSELYTDYIDEIFMNGSSEKSRAMFEKIADYVNRKWGVNISKAELKGCQNIDEAISLINNCVEKKK